MNGSAISASNRVRVLSAAAALAAIAGLAHAQVYVATTGDDAGAGTADDPVQTIGQGIQLARPSGVPVYIGQGTYTEVVELVDAVDLVGGFDPGNGWARDPSTYVTTIAGPLAGVPAIHGDSVSDVAIDGLTILGHDPSVRNQSSIAILLSDSLRVSILNCNIAASYGAGGSDGATGAAGGWGGNGGIGRSGCEDGGVFCQSCSRPSGGSGGWSSGGSGYSGGDGGDAGWDTSWGHAGGWGNGPSFGIGGSGTPPGKGDWFPTSSYLGEDGGNGLQGATGAGGPPLGAFDSSGYLTAVAGATGERGGYGSGGGGGGGGGGGSLLCKSYGGGGGGGGGGGEGGAGGIGGNGAAGSFALVFIDSVNCGVTDCTIVTDDGGIGGVGGFGGAGGRGGLGGYTSGSKGNYYGGANEQDDGSNGGRGGWGGWGGPGGKGGGGGGGPSMGIVDIGASPVLCSGNTYLIGRAGRGGIGDGTRASFGAPGFVAEVFRFGSNDCNGNGIDDTIDISSGASTDCNGNGRPDECDIPTNEDPDCSGNGVPDICEGYGPLDGADLDFPAGSGSYVQVGPASDLEPSAAFTFEAWINPDGPGSDANAGGAIISKEGEYLLQRFPDGEIRWALPTTNPGWRFNATGAYAPVGAWSHLAFVYEEPEVRIYMNGKLIVSVANEGPIVDVLPNLNDFRIGGRQGAAQRFEGRIDDVRFWDVARTQGQIVADLARALTGNEPGLTGYWPLDTVNGNVTPDLAGVNDGTLVNGPVLTTALLCEGCPGDFNGDGTVNTLDVLAFLNAWSSGDPRGDFNGDGTVNTLDVLAFLNAWSAGC